MSAPMSPGSIRTLRGITWAHARGYAPLAAASQAFTDLHPDIEIAWDKRSLFEFGEGALEPLAERYDLIVFDHPFTGVAAEQQLFLPLDRYLEQALLHDLRDHSVGPSYRSYTYGGRQWGLPIDGASQAAASRPDLLTQHGCALPQSWADVLDLATDTGKVAVPLTRQSALSSFFTLCAQAGDEPCRGEHLVSRDAGLAALDRLKGLYTAIDARCLSLSPVAVLNEMACRDTILYVPLSYSYSNYSRPGYAARVIAFHDIPALERGTPATGATLGGAAIAVSSRSRHQDDALQYVAWIAGRDCQQSLYVLSGGQPAHRAAWDDDLANRVTNEFFRATRRSIEQAYLRPNYVGFPAFQRAAGAVVQDCLAGKLTIPDAFDALDRLYAVSRAAAR